MTGARLGSESALARPESSCPSDHTLDSPTALCIHRGLWLTRHLTSLLYYFLRATVGAAINLPFLSGSYQCPSFYIPQSRSCGKDLNAKSFILELIPGSSYKGGKKETKSE